MTTIACTRDEMAADSQATAGSKIAVPKLFVIDQYIIGAAGTASEIAEVVAIVREALKSEDVPLLDALRFLAGKKKDTNMLILCPNGTIKIFEGGGAYTVNQKFAAIGTGELGALCLLSEGYSPVEAIKVCRKHDAFTGGRIQLKRRADVINGKT